MQVPAQITFHQMEHDAAVEERIREKLAKLEQLHDGIISARVVVERAYHHHDHDSGPVNVRFELGLSGNRTIIGGGPGTKNDAFVDAHAALKAAFEACKRQLIDHVEKERRHTKVHEVPPHGVVTRLDPTGEFGFLQTSDGLDVYFHRNAVVEGSFDDLAIGDAIRFILHAEEGVQGPQAASVQALGKHALPPVEAVRSS